MDILEPVLLDVYMEQAQIVPESLSTGLLNIKQMEQREAGKCLAFKLTEY